MITMADADADRLQGAIDVLSREVSPFNERVFVELGDQQTFNVGPGREDEEIERFGHRDGISQPRMIKQDADEEVAQRVGASWDPSAPHSRGFVAEPGSPDRFGSYLVLRKLGQNVRTFRESRNVLAAALGASADEAAALAAAAGDRSWLLFIRRQSPLVQFVIHQEGAESHDFVKPNVGPDAELGYFVAGVAQTRPRKGALVEESFLMSKFATMLGEEYYSAPRPTVLLSLGKP